MWWGSVVDIKITRYEGFSALSCCGVVDGKWNGSCPWATGWYWYNLQSTAIYMQLSTTELVTLPQEFINKSFYYTSFNSQYSTACLSGWLGCDM